MNEFIIWDSKYKLFLDENFKDTLQDNGIDYEDDDLYYGDEYYPLCTMDFIMGSDCEPHKDRLSKLFYIGLNDINNNKIYADCSIVEFQWVNGFGNIQTDWGVFKYDLDYLQYLIYEENEDINKSSIKEVFNIKIIDTIQKNKLGLMD